MELQKLLLKIAGKDNFALDSNISTHYLLRICWKYGWMMVRGKLVAMANRKIASNVFVGRGVHLLEKRKITIGRKTKLHNYVKIDALSIEGVTIGDNVVLGCNSVIECTGGLSNVGKGISIGNRSTFGNDCFFGAAGGVTVGNDVVAGQYVRFHSENHNYSDLSELIKDQGVTHQGITIGNNCWIGAGAVFLDGAVLGDGCVVAANAVVTKKFPSNAVVGGVPAKLIKMRGD